MPETKPRLCACGKEECRPGQRNGRHCHAEAQRRYRQGVKTKLKFLDELKTMAGGKPKRRRAGR